MLIRYALHDIGFDVLAADDVAGDIAAAVMPACVRRVRRQPAAAVFEVRRQDKAYVVLRQGRALWRTAAKAELIPWFESEVVTWLLAKLNRFVQIHSAAIQDVRRRRAVLIAGGPDAGKTSLSYAAGAAGWRIMADEAAMIDPKGLAAHCFLRAMLVKPGTALQWPELQNLPGRRVLLDSGLTTVRYVDPASVGGVPRPSAAISDIVFPEWARRTAIDSLGETEAMNRLLTLTFNSGGREKRTVDTCIRLVRSCRLWRLRNADAKEAAELLGLLDD